MLQTLGTIGQFAGGLGSLLGGVGGLFGGRGSVGDVVEPNQRLMADQNMYWHRQFDYALSNTRKVNQHAVKDRVEDAKRAGIHPLAALGVAGAQAPVVSPIGSSVTGSSRGDSISRVGDALYGIGRGLSEIDEAARQRAREDIADADRYQQNKSQFMLNEATAANQRAQASYWASRALGEAQSRTIIDRTNSNQDGGAVFDTPKQRLITIPGGDKWVTSHSTTADDVQREYGDIAENVYGTYRALYDYFFNLSKQDLARRVLRSTRSNGPRFYGGVNGSVSQITAP